MNSIKDIPAYDGDIRYFSLNTYCRKTFGDKVYRLSLSSGCSCPNRDGKLSFGGCTFCSEGGSGDFAASYRTSISEQIADAKQRIAAKTDCSKYIAYFQSFTNTYGDLAHLRRIYTEAISEPDIVALSIGTRSDCLSDDILELLRELSQIKPVWVELGLQTIHNETHSRLNTHTTTEQFEDAIFRLSQNNIPVIAHVILGLPGETRSMMLETVARVAALYPGVSGIKLQLLHVLKHTKLAEEFTYQPFPVLELEEYCDLVVDCLELLPPQMVVHRLTGDGPRNLLLAPLWSTDKKRVLNTIRRNLNRRNTCQGKKYNSEKK